MDRERAHDEGKRDGSRFRPLGPRQSSHVRRSDASSGDLRDGFCTYTSTDRGPDGCVFWRRWTKRGTYVIRGARQAAAARGPPVGPARRSDRGASRRVVRSRGEHQHWARCCLPPFRHSLTRLRENGMQRPASRPILVLFDSWKIPIFQSVSDGSRGNPPRIRVSPRPLCRPIAPADGPVRRPHVSAFLEGCCTL